MLYQYSVINMTYSLILSFNIYFTLKMLKIRFRTSLVLSTSRTMIELNKAQMVSHPHLSELEEKLVSAPAAIKPAKNCNNKLKDLLKVLDVCNFPTLNYLRNQVRRKVRFIKNLRKVDQSSLTYKTCLIDPKLLFVSPSLPAHIS